MARCTLALLFLLNCQPLISDVQSIYHSTRMKELILGGPLTIAKDNVYTMTANSSPYVIPRDIVVEENAHLVIEPGVEIKFAPRLGIYVKGLLTAKGTAEKPIILTSVEPPENTTFPTDIRLVDGPAILTGRLQLFYNGKWRSVCTVSRNWTKVDFETACKQLGFQGGELWDWLAPQNETSRLLYEQPACEGNETTLFHCNNWSLRKMGGGVCDNHPDLGITCSMQHANIPGINKYWRGIHFENAQYRIAQRSKYSNYEHISSSELAFVDIRYAGVGTNYTAVSALSIEGVPPPMRGINVSNSAYDGIMINASDASTSLNQCNVNRNRGHGLYISHSLDPINVFGCSFMENGGDGMKLSNDQRKKHEEYNQLRTYDICNTQTFVVRYFPTFIRAVQDEYSHKDKECSQIIETHPGQIFTLNFLSMWTDSATEDGAIIEVSNASVFYKDFFFKEHFVGRINITNDTTVQSLTSLGGLIHIHFKVKPNTRASVFMKLSTTYGQLDDIAVRNTTVAHNKGSGIKMVNLQNSLHIYDSHMQNNSQAGIQVLHGIGNVFVKSSKIVANNEGGISIAYSGGIQIVSECEISFNKGHGVSIWPKKGAANHYISYEQDTILKGSQIISNEFGILIGNYCRNSNIEITENNFLENENVVISISTCTNENGSNLKVEITHNTFVKNQKLGIRFKPAVNIKVLIENNEFLENNKGCMLIRNEEKDHLHMMPVNLTISENVFKNNRGAYVVNFGLSPNSKVQTLLFLRNTLTNNSIQEPFKLVPRSSAAAVIIVGSENIIVNRNLLDNYNSTYEIATHIANPNVAINCRLNWLGFSDVYDISMRIFDRGHRHNLAKILFIPFLLNNTDPGSSLTTDNQKYLPLFKVDDSNIIGGELSGTVHLNRGTYVVERDIHVLPNSKLILQPGVILRFSPCVGMIVSGSLEADGGVAYDQIGFILHKNRITNEAHQDKIPEIPSYNGGNVRLIGGNKETEGQLQVLVGKRWGTVCSYGWSKIDAAIACHSLGLVLDPDNWYMRQEEIPNPSVNLPILLSNVQCTEEDTDIMSCKAERELDLENSCTHEDDVGLQCKKVAWAGVRFTLLAETSKLDHVVVSDAGLLDYSTYTLKPAIQIDFNQHILSALKIIQNIHDGLAIMYTNVYASKDANILKKCALQDNKQNGIIMHQLRLHISDSRFSGNGLSGINYSPIINSEQQKELVGWLKVYSNQELMAENENSLRSFVVIPQYQNDTIYVTPQRTKLILTERVGPQSVTQNIKIMCDSDYVIAIQILNSQQYGSTEEVIIYDGENIHNATNSWNVQKDLLEYPLRTNLSEVFLYYRSGSNALGDIVFTISAVPASNKKYDVWQDYKHYKAALIISSSLIQYNKYGLKISFSGRCGEESKEVFIGSSNEIINLEWSDVKLNFQEAVYIDSPVSYSCHPNIIDTTLKITYSTFLYNEKGILQSNSNYGNTNHVFHWIFQNNNIESCQEGGFEVSLPVFSDVTVTNMHSIEILKTDWKNNDKFKFDISGGTASLSILDSLFLFNYCEDGLIFIHGMEKCMRIANNIIRHNMGHYILKSAADIHSELIKGDSAIFTKNDVKYNQYFEDHPNSPQVLRKPSSILQICGIQKVQINRNLFEENSMDYDLIADMETARLGVNIDAKENWWGSINENYIESRIMDFNEINSYANVLFRPFLAFGEFASPVATYQSGKGVKVSPFIGGPVYEDITLEPARRPYIIINDITVMPNVSLTIKPNVTILFAPSIGILVLGNLYAKGKKNGEINLLPLASSSEGCSVSNIKKPGVGISDEERYEDCSPNMSDNETCKVETNCFPSHIVSVTKHMECTYWGGIRFARPGFEDLTPKYISENNVAYPTASALEYVNIEGAGILHGHVSPCIQIVSHPTNIWHSNISSCASDGINIISTMYDSQLLSNRITTAMGVGISIISFQESKKDEFIPLSRISIPDRPFGVLNMCDSSKIIYVKQRVILYFQHKHFSTVTACLKIFKNEDKSKGLKFRFLQFSLFSSTDNFSSKDGITFYDGDITGNTSTIIARLDKNSTIQPHMFSINGSVLSVKLFLSEGNKETGFVAEVLSRDMEQSEIGTTAGYNISFCVIEDNRKGAIQFVNVNELKSMVSMEWNRFTGNCKLLYRNYNTCKAAVQLDIHDTQAVVVFKNNLVKENEGGLLIKTASTAAPRVSIMNNLFYENKISSALHVEANQSVPAEQFGIYGNFFINNCSPYKSTIFLKQVTFNFSYNYIYNNHGNYILEICGYDQEKLSQSQEIANNHFYQNEALNEFGGTILAGAPGQRISDNAFLNPQNNYEIVCTNTSLLNVTQERINLTNNLWDFNSVQQENKGKCTIPLSKINNTCYSFMGVPALFQEMPGICEAINASHLVDEAELLNIYTVLQNDQLNYYAPKQMSTPDKYNGKCLLYNPSAVEVDTKCEDTHPFICAMDREVTVQKTVSKSKVILSWTVGGITVLLIIIIAAYCLLRGKRIYNLKNHERELEFTHEQNQDTTTECEELEEVETPM